MELEEEHRRSKAYWDRVAAARSQAAAQFRYQYDFLDRYGTRLKEPILDVGCGDGELMERLLREGRKEVYGIDISEVAVGLARQRLGHLMGEDTERKVRLGDMLELSSHFATGFFNTVFCEGTFHQTTCGGARRTALEIAKVVRKGGLVYISVRSDSTPPKNSYRVEGEEETYRLSDEGGIARCYFSEQGILRLVQGEFDVLEMVERDLLTKLGKESYKMRILVLRRK